LGIMKFAHYHWRINNPYNYPKYRFSGIKKSFIMEVVVVVQIQYKGNPNMDNHTLLSSSVNGFHPFMLKTFQNKLCKPGRIGIRKSLRPTRISSCYYCPTWKNRTLSR